MMQSPPVKRFKLSDALNESPSPSPTQENSFFPSSLEAPYFSFEDRENLNAQVLALKPETLADFVQFIKAMRPSEYKDPNEIEIDFETLEPAVLVEIKRFLDHHEALRYLAISHHAHHHPSHHSHHGGHVSSVAKKPSPVRQRKEAPHRPDRFCSSCRTRSTPTWRESDGTILCNACGLRLSKLGLRCSEVSCGYVPHSSEVHAACPQCNSLFTAVNPDL